MTAWSRGSSVTFCAPASDWWVILLVCIRWSDQPLFTWSLQRLQFPLNWADQNAALVFLISQLSCHFLYSVCLILLAIKLLVFGFRFSFFFIFYFFLGFYYKSHFYMLYLFLSFIISKRMPKTMFTSWKNGSTAVNKSHRFILWFPIRIVLRCSTSSRMSQVVGFQPSAEWSYVRRRRVCLDLRVLDPV